MNINNLHEAIPVEKELPPVEDAELGNTSDFVTGYDENGKHHIVFFDHDEKVWATHYWQSMPKIVKWLRPIPRERVEEALREFSDKVVKKTMESHYRYIGGFTDNSKLELEAALTELINQTLGL